MIKRPPTWPMLPNRLKATHFIEQYTTMPGTGEVYNTPVFSIAILELILKSSLDSGITTIAIFKIKYKEK